MKETGRVHENLEEEDGFQNKGESLACSLWDWGSRKRPPPPRVGHFPAILGWQEKPWASSPWVRIVGFSQTLANQEGSDWEPNVLFNFFEMLMNLLIVFFPPV